MVVASGRKEVRNYGVPRHSVDCSRVAGHHFEEVARVFVPKIHLGEEGATQAREGERDVRISAYVRRNS